MIKETNTKDEAKVPILGDLPIIGWLFKNSSGKKEQSNLIVFITPHIVHSAEEHKSILSDKLKERLNFIRKFTGEEDPYKDYTKQMETQSGLTKDFSPPQEEEPQADGEPASEEYDMSSADWEPAPEEYAPQDAVYFDEDDILSESPES